MSETIAIIFSSGIISLLTTLLINLFLLGSYKNKVDRAERDIQDLNRLAREVSEIKGGLDRDRVHSGLVKKKSPLTITDKGFQALSESGALEYISANKTKWIQTIEDQNPKTPYDIQELSKVLIEKQKNTDDFIPIKNYVYAQGIPLEDMIITMTVYLRDLILKGSDTR